MQSFAEFLVAAQSVVSGKCVISESHEITDNSLH
jgi:hypothetical protein